MATRFAILDIGRPPGGVVDARGNPAWLIIYNIWRREDIMNIIGGCDKNLSPDKIDCLRNG